ncbi:MAG TPA: hypothetical protein VJT73_02550 [Polyangiaceae bacterium]|nr:hypothetical protein [Polyangiaceae bacterium]
MNLVNGFPCRNCADAELAKRGIDPARPRDELLRGEAFAQGDAKKRGERFGINEPVAHGEIGTRLNLSG